MPEVVTRVAVIMTAVVMMTVVAVVTMVVVTTDAVHNGGYECWGRQQQQVKTMVVVMSAVIVVAMMKVTMIGCSDGDGNNGVGGHEQVEMATAAVKTQWWLCLKENI
jgi:hypothetical protein